jgi:hypothetical protein
MIGGKGTVLILHFFRKKCLEKARLGLFHRDKKSFRGFVVGLKIF